MKDQNLSSNESTVPRNFDYYLQVYCKSNNIGFPFYKMTSIEVNHHMCHCTTLVPFGGMKQFLTVISFGRTTDLAKEEAAKKMQNRIETLVTLPIVSQNRTEITERTVDEKKKKDEYNQLKSNPLSNHYNNISHQKNDIFPDNDKGPLNEMYYIKKNELNQLKDVSKDQGIREICNLTRSQILSTYHDQMVKTFGHDNRKHYILQELSELYVLVVDFESKHKLMINEIDEINHNTSYPFETYLNHLDSIMINMNISIESSLFNRHDGKYFRIIRADTIPEIIETEVGSEPDTVGVKAFCTVIDRLRQFIK